MHSGRRGGPVRDRIGTVHQQPRDSSRGCYYVAMTARKPKPKPQPEQQPEPTPTPDTSHDTEW